MQACEHTAEHDYVVNFYPPRSTDLQRLMSEASGLLPRPSEARSRCICGAVSMRPDEDADLQLAIALSKTLMVSAPATLPPLTQQP